MKPEQFAQALADGPWAWPGGYPRYFIASDGEAISFDAARENQTLILDALACDEKRSGWYVEAVDINWENADLYCGHTGERIQCAYGEDE